MSMNYIFGISVFLLCLVLVNIYFFYNLSTTKPTPLIQPRKTEALQNVHKEIYEQFMHLQTPYKVKTSKFIPIQQALVKSFNSTKNTDSNSVWQTLDTWSGDESLFPDSNGDAGRILHVLKSSQIVLVDNAPKGTQLKLLLILEGKQKVLFKPKRYNLTEVIKGPVYAGFDRYNSEVFAYYLGIVLNMKWIAPAVTMKLNMEKDILPVATLGLKETMVKNEFGATCVYGKCYYCKVNETVCPDNTGVLEGAAILYFDKQFKVHKSPWRRSYSKKKMDWEKDTDFCKKLTQTLSLQRILNLIDVAVFDFLIQNGDRHHYEVYKNKIVILDNGKGLGNPTIDVLDVLAPLYQCCMISEQTWRHLELISGGSLSETIKLLSSFQGETLATEEHFTAIERRLLKVYATVQYCIEKYGARKVFKDTNEI